MKTKARREREEGYVLFGIAIGLVILGISMTAAVPLWQKVVQREREKELIFRGYQYMQAIELYQRKYPGAFPPNLDVLIEEKFLRREYKDPFSETEEGSFRILRQLSPELQQAAQQQAEEAARASGISNLNRSQGRMRQPGQSTPGGPGSNRSLAGSQFQSAMGRGQSDQSLGGIVGVASSSDEETFYQVPGKETYKDWLFVYGVQQPAAVAAAQVQPGAQVTNPSPFPGLPPPPGLTSFRFGSTPLGGASGAQQPGQQNLPGQPGSQVRPGQPSVGPPRGPSQPSGFGQPSRQQQERQRNQRRQP